MLGIIICAFVIKNSNRKTARAEVEANTKTKATTAKEAKSKVVKADNSKLFIVAGLLMVPLAIATLVQTATAITSSFEFTISTMFDIKDRIEVTYEVNGEPKSEVIHYGGKVEDINQPQIPGYTFIGWTDDDGNPVDPEAPIYDDTHINPVFAVHHYSIHFNGNEATSGEMQDQQFVYDQAQTLTKNAFAKTGHNFSGWNYLDEDNNNVHYGDEANIENLTTVDNKVIEFVAEWTPITYHIKIDTDDDNTTDIDEELKYGECYTLPTNEAVKIGYTANGWLINGVHYANVAEVCNLTTEDGGEVVIKPDYTVNHYTIHFDGNEATSGTMNDIAAEYDQEYVLPLNTFERTGFEYADWTLDGNIVGDGTTVKNLSAEDGATVTLVARWSKDVYDINYSGLEGATVVGNPTRYDVEQEVILNAPTKTGYIFEGWTGSNGEIPMLVAMIPSGSTGAKNFTAHWLPISYTVHFDGNGSDDGSMQDQEFFYDTAQALNTNNFTRTGYTFAGWNTKADKSGDNYTNEQEVINLTAENNATVTLYAQLTPIHYNVAFHKNSDSATGETATITNIAYDDSVNLTANGFSYEHYKFMGWNTAEDGTGTPFEDQEIISNLTTTDGETINLYALWKERTAMLQTGPNVKSALSNLNNTATTFKRYDGASAPDLDSISDKVDIALPTSSFPVWAWSEGDNIYWWSEAEAPKFNPASSNFFNGLSFTSIDVSGLDASSATNMNGMFANLRLTSLNLSGFDSSAAKNMGSMFSGTTISSLDLSSLNTSSVTTMGSMFYRAKIDSLKLYDETNPSESLFKTDNVTEMAGMFRESNIPSIDASKFNTAKVKDFSCMFMSTSATTIDVSGWNTESATDFTNAFANVKITSLDLSHFNTKKVKSMLGMFDGTVKMENLNVSGWDNESLTTIGYMFRSCGSNVTNGATINLAGFTTSKVKSMYLMFSGSGFTSLNLGSFSSAELTDMSKMFSGMGKIQSLSFGPDFTAEHVTNMDSAFAQMGKSMVNLDLSSLNVSSVTNLNGAFASNNAVTIDLTGWDFSNVESANNTFYGANYIATIYASSDFPASLGGTSFAYGQPIKGGAGTTYIGNENTYARIDDPDNNKPGHFTLKNAVYVKYYGNGSDDDSYEIMPSHYVSAAEPYDIKLKPNAFVKEGYKFMGWATSANSTTIAYADGAALEGLTASKTPLELYAVWNKIEAIFNSNTSSTLDNIHTSNSAASKFKKYPNGQPSDEILANATDVSSTDDPIWVWPDGENIYFWSEDELPAFPANMARFFHQTTLSEIDLNDTEANVTNMTWTFANTSTLKKVDLGNNFDTTNNTSLSATFGNATNLETIIFGDKFTTKNVTTTDWMFNSTGKLKTADVASFDVSKVQNMIKMFVGCGLENLDLSSWNTPALKGSLDGTFSSGAIKSITFGQGFDTGNVTSMSGTFAGIKATSLDISMFNTEKVTTMASMFSSSAMTSLDLSNFSSAALTNMGSMFYKMGNLTSITFGPNFTAESVTNIASLFDGASSIEYLDLTGLHVPAQTSMNRTFMDMHKLKTLDITGWDLTHVTDTNNAFANEKVVETIYASSKFLPENLPSGGFEFGNWTLGGHLVGGAGTECATNVSGVYARIDDPDNGEPGYFTRKGTRYIRYHDNDGDTTNDEANLALMKSEYLKAGDSLTKNAFVRDGYVFTGWKDADNNEYTDEQVMADLTESKTPLELYAQWRKNTAITIKRYRLMNADGSYPDEYIIESSEEMPMAIATSQTYSKSVEGYQTQSTDSYTTIGEDIVYSLDLPRNQYSLTIQINDEYLMFNDMDHYSNNSITIDDIYWGQNVNLGNYVSITTMDFECLQYHDCKFKEWSQTTGTEGVFSDTSNINSTFTMGKEDTAIYGDGELIGETYSLVYDANGGTGAPDTQVYPEPIAARYISAVSFDISNQIPTRDGYGFWGWGDSATTENPVADNSDKRVDGHGYGDEFYIKQPTTTLYAIWKPISGSLQSWNGCADMSIGTPIYLLDTRDGQAYEVNKYKMNVDGTETACFTSNLNLGAWKLTGDLTSENTNLVTPIAVDADNDGISDWLDWDYTETSSYGRSSFTEPRFTFQDYFADRPYNAYGDKYGAIYNFAFATANTFNHENTWGSIAGDITADLCPSGWGMPISNEYTQLVTAYGGLAGEMNTETAPTSEEMALILQRDLNFPMSGMFYNPGAIPAEEGYGIYWSKTNPMDGTNMSALGMKITSNSKIVNSDYRIIRGNGASIRCIKR